MTGQLTLYPRPEERGFTVRLGKYNIEDSDYERLQKEFNIHLNKIDYLYYSIQSDKPRKSTDIIYE